MFVGPTFADDRALDLMWVQHDLWFKIRDAWFDENGLAMGSCFYFFSCARKALLFSTDSNPLFFPERERLPSVTMFDHRVLQGAHDVIAAYYRWLVSGIKLPAFSDDKKEYRAYLLDSWKTYLRHEIAHITFGRLDLADHVVRAVVFENTTEGYAAEERLISALHERYGSMFRSERERFSDVSTAPSDNQGYIYVMVSPALKEDFLKIGKTTRLPQKRADEISVGTGVPLRFYVVFQALVSDCHTVEQLIHTKLDSYRSNTSREFFELPLHQAVDAISLVAREYPPNTALQGTLRG